VADDPGFSEAADLGSSWAHHPEESTTDELLLCKSCQQQATPSE